MRQNEKENSSKNIPLVISEERAKELCSTGKWIADTDILDRINKESKRIQREFPEWPKSSIRPDVKMLQEFFKAAPKLLKESVETQIVHQKFDLEAHTEIRVKMGAIFKVKSTALDIAVDALSLILAVCATTPWSLLFIIWVGFSFLDLVQKLWKGYESLLDPDEIHVFEAIFRCQGRLCTINYDAVKEKNYNDAYGTVNPSVVEIENEIRGAHNKHQIVKTLANLKSRGIIVERDGLWSIAF